MGGFTCVLTELVMSGYVWIRVPAVVHSMNNVHSMISNLLRVDGWAHGSWTLTVGRHELVVMVVLLFCDLTKLQKS